MIVVRARIQMTAASREIMIQALQNDERDVLGVGENVRCRSVTPACVMGVTLCHWKG